ncbi:MAG: hypothetical protein OHK93_005291 [Ramalina farinacea]|uniref:Uncharacterized protein n=1 Tax=Ramalina farinacea TaxID=258253 RepID=A0AA43TVV4_9LECA|nr:hypothetical protein [Ramalina farinacea]
MAQDDPDFDVRSGRPKSSRAIRHNDMMLPLSKEKKTFLDYPYDVRILIYDAFFGSEFCPLSVQSIVADPKSYKSDIFWDATRGIGNPLTRMTAHHKVSLLVTCKAILDEASPFFYRAHTFHMKLLDRRRFRLGPFSQLPLPIQQGLRAITKIYLTDQPTKLTSAANSNVATYVTFLTLACVSLKSLVVDAAIHYERPGKDYSDTAFALSELWPRLDYLCLRVPESKRKGWKAYQDLVAPGVKWHCEGNFEWAGFSYGRAGPAIRRSVFFLDRSCLEKDGTAHAQMDDGKSDDTSDDTSDDSSTTTSDDDTSESDDD